VQFCAKGRLIWLNLLHSHSMLLPVFYTRQLFVSLCLFKTVILFRFWILFICHFYSLQLLSPHGELLSLNSLLNLPVETRPPACNALILFEVFHMQIRFTAFDCTRNCLGRNHNHISGIFLLTHRCNPELKSGLQTIHIQLLTIG